MMNAITADADSRRIVQTAFMVETSDYYIETFDTGARPNPWCWELRRHSRPMGVRIGAGGFQSQTAAEYAGKLPQRFLEELSRGKGRKR